MNLYEQIRKLLAEAQAQQVRQTNTLMVQTYFQIGKYIIEDEQNGQSRAEYGKETLKILSQKLSQEFGKGFSVENLDRMRFFYKTYAPKISSTPLTKLDFSLSWSHYLVLMRIENWQERAFYEIESASNNWSLRELKRQFDSALFERLALSTDKEGIQKLASEGQILEKPQDVLKDPYILEFLNLPEKHHYSESDLENALIDKLEHFLLELGKGYTFVARQKRISFDEKHFYIDLVFFNRLLKCFVLIDLKIGEIKARRQRTDFCKPLRYYFAR
jgi:predicted nuclease of restriction endonuclease-like (RecB) superfamily